MDVDLNLSLSKRGGSNRKRKKKKVTNDNTIWHTWSACVCLCVLSRDKTSGRGGGYGKARERKRSCHFWAGHMWLLTTRSLSFSFSPSSFILLLWWPFFFFFFLKNIVGFACQSRPNEKAYCHMGWKEASRQTDKLYGLHTCYALSTTAQEDAKKNNKPQRGGSTRVIRPVASHHNHKEKGESSMFEINIENREI